MRKLLFILILLITPSATLAFERITDGQRFEQLVDGRDLTRLGVRLRVDPRSGTVSGRGMGYDVDGQWRWEGGYFCRSLNWGGSDLGHNCQTVLVDGSRMRFVADRGAGMSADFRLR
jgi:hypothetical protein